MPRSIAFRVIRGLAYRTARVLLCASHLALGVFAFVMLFGVVLMVVDKGGGASGPARRDVAVAQRCAMGLLCGSLGILSVAGSLKLTRCYRTFNPLYPEKQIVFHADLGDAGERSPGSDVAMYDRDIDGAL